jgi:hypothetical protein
MRYGVDQAVADDSGKREWDVRCFAGGQCKADVFQAERHLERGGIVAPFGDQWA